MNKKLIALAVAAALAPAAAMADSGNVTIYGVAHASIDRVDPGTGTAALNDDAWRVSSNSSRIGFKGTEDLGNGLSAVWQMESGVNMDSGNTASTNNAFMMRNTFVGLSSKTAGTVLLGRHDTPYKLGTASLDLFADTMGDYNAIVGNVGNLVAFDSRLGNVAAYISPTWSGFHFAGAVVMANETNNTANKDGKAYSLTGVYSNGPMFASLSYEQAKDINASSTDVVGGTLATTLASLTKATGTKLGLGYNFGAATVGFIAERIKVEDAVGSDTRNAFYLNGSYKMGSNVLKAAYGQANDWSDTSDTSARQFVIGVDHNLSKRTVAYALYSKMNNDTAGGYGLGGNGAGGAFGPAAAGQDPSVISLGMKHSF
jgi:predicted porin